MNTTLTDLGLATRATQMNNSHSGADSMGGFKV